MHESSQVQSILFVLLACLLTAVLMMRLRQPTLVGYILGGIVIGPHVLGIVPYDNVAMLADLGVSLLLFTVGIELSIRKLIRVRYISILGGIVMLALTGLAF